MVKGARFLCELAQNLGQVRSGAVGVLNKGSGGMDKERMANRAVLQGYHESLVTRCCDIVSGGVAVRRGVESEKVRSAACREEGSILDKLVIHYHNKLKHRALTCKSLPSLVQPQLPHLARHSPPKPPNVRSPSPKPTHP